ncbi:MAG TPA: DNA replication and repair protein RecF [Coriobacteriia bacterium]|nr:DNA replication and repair protein RecF [Coriobacteriia bacterium]
MFGLHLSSVSLASFRNHESWEHEFDGPATILVGKNAAGKTNILEAITVTARGSSFRPFRWEDLVSHGCERASVALTAVRAGTTVGVEVRIVRDGAREYSLNGRLRRAVSDVSRKIPLVTFVPEDLALSKGPSEARRGSLDSLGDRLASAYSAIRIEYGRLVRQRNALIRQGAPARDLEPWDEMLADVGASFATHRIRLLSRLAAPASRAYSEISDGELLSIGYRASWADSVIPCEGAPGVEKSEIRMAILEGLHARRDHERERGSTLTGPHRDDVSIQVTGRSARRYASQGQHRSVALSWKLAELEVVREVSGAPPVLLLDDVMSEFDARRREALSARLLGGSQTIITTTNLDYFSPDLLERAAVVAVGDV